MRLLAAAWLALSLGAGAGLAQQPGAGGRAAVADSPAGMGQAGPELRRRLEEYRRRRIAEALELDSARTDVVERELERFRDRHLELRRERERLLAELRRNVEAPDRDDVGLERTLEALSRNQQARDRALLDLKDRLARELTVEQRARLALLAERFQGRLAEGLSRIRERREAAGAGLGPGLRDRAGEPAHPDSAPPRR